MQAAVALVLLLALNTAWLRRINRRVGTKGWDHLVSSARRHVAGWIGALAARIDSSKQHDEI